MAIVFAATALGALAFTAGAGAAAVAPQTTQGTDFWLTFEGNYDGQSDLYLFIAGDTATSGTVSEPGISFSQSFTVTPGTVTQVTIPSAGQDLTSDAVGDYGIHVTADDPVSVYGLNTEEYSTDGFLGLPTDILGQNYIVEAYTNDIGSGSQFSVVGTADGTNVTIVPSETIGSHPAGTPYTVQLNQGQTYQLNDAGVSNGDLTGTQITSSQPVAVFGGSNCADVPAGYTACNTLTEELTPVTAWGTSFVTEPLATRSGDTFRFLASEDDTTVQVNGTTVATLNANDFYETELSAASVVTSDKPIFVTQFSNSSSYDNASADPFSVTIPPYGQFLNSYTVTTEPDGADPAITANYINVVAPTSEVGSVTLDGTAIPASDFSAIPGSSFSGAQVPVPFGSHVLGGPLPFGITVYGFGDYDGYGYPGGFTLSPLAVVSNVALSRGGGGTAPVGGTATATATVTDQNGNPLEGVRVDFTVTGANPQTGFAYTDASGDAVFTYTGNNVGTDTITAAVQSVTSSPVTWTWTAHAPAPTSMTTKLAAGQAAGTSVTVPAGTAVTDSATLAGTNAATATGSVTYNMYSDNACTKVVRAGEAEAITTPGTLPASAPVTLDTAGTYYWQASYSGDPANEASLSRCGSETETVTAAPTTLATSLSGGGKSGTAISVPAGTAVTDTATLSGAVASGATGSVTYDVYSNSSCTKLAAGSSKESVSAGKPASSAAVTLTVAGTYYWTASYSGDASDLASASKCGTEKLTITPLPAIDTLATASGKSSAVAQVSSNASGDLAVAFVAANGPGNKRQSATVSGGGLAWHLITRQNPDGSDTEVWTATSSGKLTRAAVTAKAGTAGYDVVVSVVTFRNASGVGPQAFASAAKGAPHGTLKTTVNNTWVFAVGADWSTYAEPTTASGQLIVSSVDAPGGKTVWLQATSTLAGLSGTSVTISDIRPASDPYDLLMVGIH